MADKAGSKGVDIRHKHILQTAWGPELRSSKLLSTSLNELSYRTAILATGQVHTDSHTRQLSYCLYSTITDARSVRIFILTRRTDSFLVESDPGGDLLTPARVQLHSERAGTVLLNLVHHEDREHATADPCSSSQDFETPFGRIVTQPAYLRLSRQLFAGLGNGEPLQSPLQVIPQ